MKYSIIHKELHTHLSDNDLAYITHHLQSVREYPIEEESTPVVSDWLAEYNAAHSFSLPIEYDVPFPPPAQPEFTFIDLFAGIGGFRIPLQRQAGKCVFSSEFNIHAQRVYEANYGEFPFGDITQIPVDKIPVHDVLCAGFPCQPFSISGKMKGFEDTRGTLIYNVFKIIEAKRPKVVFLENVKHLVHHNHGNTLATILRGLCSLGYETSWQVLNASNFGVPQNRERIIIIGHPSRKFNFNALSYHIANDMRGIMDQDESCFEYLTEPYTLLDNPKKQPSGLVFAGYRNKKIRKAGVRPGTENLSRVHKQPNRIYSIEGVHPALPSQETSGRFWIYDGSRVRKLTLNECYKLMGFPADFIKDDSQSEQYRQIGNSVCIPMIEEIAKQIKIQLL